MTPAGWTLHHRVARSAPVIAARSSCSTGAAGRKRAQQSAGDGTCSDLDRMASDAARLPAVSACVARDATREHRWPEQALRATQHHTMVAPSLCTLAGERLERARLWSAAANCAPVQEACRDRP